MSIPDDLINDDPTEVAGVNPAHWISTMDRDEAVSAALQLQHDAGLIMSNL